MYFLISRKKIKKKQFHENFKKNLLFLIYRSAGGRVQKPGRGSPRRGAGGRGGGRGRGGKAKREPAPSAEELDKELDNYLKAR